MDECETTVKPEPIDDDLFLSAHVKSCNCGDSTACCCNEQNPCSSAVVVIDNSNSNAAAETNSVADDTEVTNDVTLSPYSTEYHRSLPNSSTEIPSRIYICRVCSKRCSRIPAYEHHWAEYHPDVDAVHMYENPSRCSACGRYFPTYPSLRQHIGSVHKTMPVESINVGAKQQSQEVIRYCPICNFSFFGYKGLEQHFNLVHGGLKGPVVNNSTNASQIPLISCSKCQLVCRSVAELNYHIANSCINRTSPPVIVQKQPPIDRPQTDAPPNVTLVYLPKSATVSNVQQFRLYGLDDGTKMTPDSDTDSPSTCGQNISGRGTDVYNMQSGDNDEFRNNESGTSTPSVINLNDNVRSVTVATSNECQSVCHTKVVDLVGTINPVSEEGALPCDDDVTVTSDEIRSTSDDNDSVRCPSIAENGQKEMIRGDCNLTEADPLEASTSSSRSHQSIVNNASKVHSVTDGPVQFCHQCSECQYTTDDDLTLFQHMRLVHGCKICLFCDYVAKTSDLFVHMKLVHAAELIVKESPSTSIVTMLPVAIGCEPDSVAEEPVNGTNSNKTLSVPWYKNINILTPLDKKSYAKLITEAIEQSPEGWLTLSQIYDWVSDHVPRIRDQGYCDSSASWKNSIRHTLSLDCRFVKIPSSKSSFWTLKPASELCTKAPCRCKKLKLVSKVQSD